jgi:hypothetical protein
VYQVGSVYYVISCFFADLVQSSRTIAKFFHLAARTHHFRCTQHYEPNSMKVEGQFEHVVLNGNMIQP